MDGSGYVVVWESFDGVSTGVFGRRYNSGGAVQASEFHLHSDISGIEVEPALAIRGGSFVAAWNQNYAPTPDSIRARGFNSQNAAPLGDVQVNLYANQNQLRAKVARSGPGFVVVWDSQSQDGSGYGIFGRRLLLGAGLDVDGNGVVDPLTDTLLALRYAFGFRGSTLIAGAVGAGCRRCDAPSIEAYLAGMV
jgi:hypothetical protein